MVVPASWVFSPTSFARVFRRPELFSVMLGDLALVPRSAPSKVAELLNSELASGMHQ